MRIISGKFKGRKLLTPNSNLIRPTSDRAKETIFNALESFFVKKKIRFDVEPTQDELDSETDKAFEFNFKIENIKLIPGSYNVAISKQLLAKFTNSNYNLDYYIALEPDSTYE